MVPNKLLEFKSGDEYLAHIGVDPEFIVFSEEDEFKPEVVKPYITDLTLVLGSAGAGKSTYTIQRAIERVGIDAVLVVCNQNIQCLEISLRFGVRAITLHKFMGWNRSETANKKGYPIDNIKILIFDEIFMMSNPAINRIKQKLFEMEKRPEIIAIIIRDDMQ